MLLNPQNALGILIYIKRQLQTLEIPLINKNI